MKVNAHTGARWAATLGLSLALLATGLAPALPAAADDAAPSDAPSAGPSTGPSTGQSTGQSTGASTGATAARRTTDAPPTFGDGTTHAISYDKYSLKIDGERQYVWSGEFHPFRLPNPDLWRDMLEKYKANGMNTVS